MLAGAAVSSLRPLLVPRRIVQEKEDAMTDSHPESPRPEPLMPCPFCGRTDNLNWQPSWVCCDGCGALGPAVRFSGAAIAAWNRRVAPPASPSNEDALIEAAHRAYVMVPNEPHQRRLKRVVRAVLREASWSAPHQGSKP